MMLHRHHFYSCVFLITVLYGQSHQNPLDLDLISLRAAGDEGGSLSPEDFEEAENADYSEQEDHDEDGATDLLEGDIMLNEEDRTAMDNGISLREVVGSVARKWPNVKGVVKVPYTFPSGLSSSRKKDIARVVQEYEQKTCIRLVPRKNEKAYVHLNTGASGCASPLGRQGNKQIVSFGSSCTWGNLLHEFMHSLGFFHEHTRSDRDKYITVNWANIDKFSKEQGKSWKHNFDKCTKRGCHDLKVGYDYASIMHYGPKLGRYQVLTPKTKGKKFGQRKRLSAKDLEGINEHYGCGRSSGCVDEKEACAGWAKKGWCKGKHEDYLKTNCKASCKLC